MKLQTLVSSVRDRYHNLPPQQKPTTLGLGALICGLILVIVFKLFMILLAPKNPAKPPPMLIREGANIIIPEGSPLRSKMTIKPIQSSKAPHIVSIPGIVEAFPSLTVNVLPPLTGRLLSLRVLIGDVVKKGQVLAVISSPALAQAYSDKDKAISLVALTQTALKRAEQVNKAGANSIKEVENAKNDYMQAVAEARRANKTLSILGRNHHHLLSIKAPIFGKVTALNYGIGSYINDTTATLLTISNIKAVWVTANIPENIVGAVHKNLPVDITLLAYPNHHWKSKVSFVNSFLEADTRRNKTRIALPNPRHKLQPNMFATIKMSLTEPNLVVIPLSAVLMNDDTTAVYVETAPWTLTKRTVKLGNEDGNTIRVVSGLKPGERVVINGGVLVNDQ